MATATATHNLPTLTNWAKQHLSTLYRTTTQVDFENAFDAFVAKDATITVNGKPTSRDEFKAHLKEEKFNENGATVQYRGVVESPKEAGKVEAGTVGLFYEAIIYEPFENLSKADTKDVVTSLNITVGVDESIKHGHDHRRATVIYEVTSQKELAAEPSA